MTSIMAAMQQGVAVVNQKGEGRILRGHPWVFRGDVIRAEAAPGAVVRVIGWEGRTLGFAFFSARSQIQLRMIERGASLAPTFVRDRLAGAISWRETVAPGVSACRLVHGEGDRLPSLVVDRYGEYLVIQTLSQATDALKGELVAILTELLKPRGILERNDPKVRLLEGLEQRVSALHGDVPQAVEVEEFGLRLEVDLWKGQKTGLFLDQRENHLMARTYARGRVLDAFSYIGGFALHVASVADEVLAVDISSSAVQAIRGNALRNGLDNVVVQEANVFDLLRDLEARGERFSTVILDPPAFAKSKHALGKAWRGYKEINLRALKLLEPGGCLITCSCSYHLHEADFEGILASAASDAGAHVTVVEKRRQGRDHPVLLGVPETYYLKCFVLRRLS